MRRCRGASLSPLCPAPQVPEVLRGWGILLMAAGPAIAAWLGHAAGGGMPISSAVTLPQGCTRAVAPSPATQSVVCDGTLIRWQAERFNGRSSPQTLLNAQRAPGRPRRDRERGRTQRRRRPAVATGSHRRTRAAVCDRVLGHPEWITPVRHRVARASSLGQSAPRHGERLAADVHGRLGAAPRCQRVGSPGAAGQGTALTVSAGSAEARPAACSTARTRSRSFVVLCPGVSAHRMTCPPRARTASAPTTVSGV